MFFFFILTRPGTALSPPTFRRLPPNSTRSQIAARVGSGTGTGTTALVIAPLPSTLNWKLFFFYFITSLPPHSNNSLGKCSTTCARYGRNQTICVLSLLDRTDCEEPQLARACLQITCLLAPCSVRPRPDVPNPVSGRHSGTISSMNRIVDALSRLLRGAICLEY